MTNMSNEEHAALLYKYAFQLNSLISSGQITRQSLGVDQMSQWAVTKALELIGEEAWVLSKAQYDLGPDIPLDDIGYMRHHLVHHYEGIDWSIAEEAAFEDVPELVKNLRPILEERGIEVYASSNDEGDAEETSGNEFAETNRPLP